MSKTLFEKIIDREIPATIVYEDDLVLHFGTSNRRRRRTFGHSEKPIPRIAEAKPEDHKVLGHLLLKAAEVANQLGSRNPGFVSCSTMGLTQAKPCRTCIVTLSADGNVMAARMRCGCQ